MTHNRMITVEQADQILLSHTMDMPAVSCPVADAFGRILRADIAAERDIPPYDRVMMDGIAVARDALARGRRHFRIESTQGAGSPAAVLRNPAENCVQIMTGAVLPQGSDCVIPYEELSVEGDEATVKEEAPFEALQYVHRAGSDRRRGDVLLRAGCALRSPQIAIAAATGRPEVMVARGPSVAIVANGDELVELGGAVQPWQIYPSNRCALQAGLRALRLDRVDAFQTSDDKPALRAQMETLAGEYEMILMSGGVSAGRYDYVPEVLAELGVRKLFHKISQRPGKPFWFGALPSGGPVFALPGNPVATMICFHRYVLPYLRRALHATPQPPEYVELTAGVAFAPPLTYFCPVTLQPEPDGCLRALPVRIQNSGDYAALAETDGFVELPLEEAEFPAGTFARFHRWTC